MPAFQSALVVPARNPSVASGHARSACFRSTAVAMNSRLSARTVFRSEALRRAAFRSCWTIAGRFVTGSGGAAVLPTISAATPATTTTSSTAARTSRRRKRREANRPPRPACGRDSTPLLGLGVHPRRSIRKEVAHPPRILGSLAHQRHLVACRHESGLELGDEEELDQHLPRELPTMSNLALSRPLTGYGAKEARRGAIASWSRRSASSGSRGPRRVRDASS